MIASAMLACGCVRTSNGSVFIGWKKCAQHYDPAVDDEKILEAYKNNLKFEEACRRADAELYGRK